MTIADRLRQEGRIMPGYSKAAGRPAKPPALRIARSSAKRWFRSRYRYSRVTGLAPADLASESH